MSRTPLIALPLLALLPLLACAPLEGDADGGDGQLDAGAPGDDAGALPDAGDADGGEPPYDGGEPDGGGELPPPPTLSVTGSVIDFQSRAPVEGAATLSPLGILPPPGVSVQGADFTLTDVAGNSIFTLLAGAPGYRSTISLPVAVDAEDVSGVTVEALGSAWLTDAADTFGVTLQAGTSVVVARTIAGDGGAVTGIPAASFRLNGAAPAYGPYFLNGQRQPDDGLTATSASGYVLFFNVPPGEVLIEDSPGSAWTLISPTAQATADTATRVDVLAEEGELELPVDVDFQDDIIPLLVEKGCAYCHSGNGIGRDLGNLTLDASPNLIYSEMTQEVSDNYDTKRVDLENPEASVLLVVPTTGSPLHPIQMFQGYADPDYRTMLSWIIDGAPRN